MSPQHRIVTILDASSTFDPDDFRPDGDGWELKAIESGMYSAGALSAPCVFLWWSRDGVHRLVAP